MIAQLLRAGMLGAAILMALLAVALHDGYDWPWPGATALALLALPGGISLLMTIQFLAATWLGDRQWRGMLRAWASEIPSSLRCFWFVMPLLGNRPLASAHGSRIPVLLVHGYFCNRAVWRTLAPWLQGRGHPFGTVNLEPPFGSIDDYAPIIANGIEALVTATRSDQVVLIGHSMGGLAIRACLRAHGATRVAAAISIGTPHRGTRIAAHGLPLNVRQMRYHSAWLDGLDRAQPGLDPGRWTVILSENDNIVYPQREQRIDGARVTTLRGLGHLAMLDDTEVRACIGEALDRAEAGTRNSQLARDR